jgi:hypothetical protein
MIIIKQIGFTAQLLLFHTTAFNPLNKLNWTQLSFKTYLIHVNVVFLTAVPTHHGNGKQPKTF